MNLTSLVETVIRPLSSGSVYLWIFTSLHNEIRFVHTLRSLFFLFLYPSIFHLLFSFFSLFNLLENKRLALFVDFSFCLVQISLYAKEHRAHFC